MVLLVWHMNTLTMRFTLPVEKVPSLADILGKWLEPRQTATVKELLSLMGILWRATFTLRAGTYFVWQLLRLMDLHEYRASGYHGPIVVRLEPESDRNIQWSHDLLRRNCETLVQRSGIFVCWPTLILRDFRYACFCLMLAP